MSSPCRACRQVGGGSEVGNNTGCGLHNKTSGWNGVSVIYLLK